MPPKIIERNDRPTNPTPTTATAPTASPPRQEGISNVTLNNAPDNESDPPTTPHQIPPSTSTSPSIAIGTADRSSSSPTTVPFYADPHRKVSRRLRLGLAESMLTWPSGAPMVPNVPEALLEAVADRLAKCSREGAAESDEEEEGLSSTQNALTNTNTCNHQEGNCEGASGGNTTKGAFAIDPRALAVSAARRSSSSSARGCATCDDCRLFREADAVVAAVAVLVSPEGYEVSKGPAPKFSALFAYAPSSSADSASGGHRSFVSTFEQRQNPYARRSLRVDTSLQLIAYQPADHRLTVGGGSGSGAGPRNYCPLDALWTVQRADALMTAEREWLLPCDCAGGLAAGEAARAEQRERLRPIVLKVPGDDYGNDDEEEESGKCHGEEGGDGASSTPLTNNEGSNADHTNGGDVNTAVVQVVPQCATPTTNQELPTEHNRRRAIEEMIERAKTAISAIPSALHVGPGQLVSFCASPTSANTCSPAGGGCRRHCSGSDRHAHANEPISHENDAAPTTSAERPTSGESNTIHVTEEAPAAFAPSSDAGAAGIDSNLDGAEGSTQEPSEQNAAFPTSHDEGGAIPTAVCGANSTANTEAEHPTPTNAFEDYSLRRIARKGRLERVAASCFGCGLFPFASHQQQGSIAHRGYVVEASPHGPRCPQRSSTLELPAIGIVGTRETQWRVVFESDEEASVLLTAIACLRLLAMRRAAGVGGIGLASMAKRRVSGACQTPHSLPSSSGAGPRESDERDTQKLSSLPSVAPIRPTVPPPSSVGDRRFRDLWATVGIEPSLAGSILKEDFYAFLEARLGTRPAGWLRRQVESSFQEDAAVVGALRRGGNRRMGPAGDGYTYSHAFDDGRRQSDDSDSGDGCSSSSSSSDDESSSDSSDDPEDGDAADYRRYIAERNLGGTRLSRHVYSTNTINTAEWSAKALGAGGVLVRGRRSAIHGYTDIFGTYRRTGAAALAYDGFRDVLLRIFLNREVALLFRRIEEWKTPKEAGEGKKTSEASSGNQEASVAVHAASSVRPPQAAVLIKPTFRPSQINWDCPVFAGAEATNTATRPSAGNTNNAAAPPPDGGLRDVIELQCDVPRVKAFVETTQLPHAFSFCAHGGGGGGGGSLDASQSTCEEASDGCEASAQLAAMLGEQSLFNPTPDMPMEQLRISFPRFWGMLTSTRANGWAAADIPVPLGLPLGDYLINASYDTQRRGGGVYDEGPPAASVGFGPECDSGCDLFGFATALHGGARFIHMAVRDGPNGVPILCDPYTAAANLGCEGADEEDDDDDDDDAVEEADSSPPSSSSSTDMSSPSDYEPYAPPPAVPITFAGASVEWLVPVEHALRVIREAAFASTQMPLVIAMEVFVKSLAQQGALAGLIETILGDCLHLPTEATTASTRSTSDDDEAQQPSAQPIILSSGLLGKIILRRKARTTLRESSSQPHVLASAVAAVDVTHSRTPSTQQAHNLSVTERSLNLSNNSQLSTTLFETRGMLSLALSSPAFTPGWSSAAARRMIEAACKEEKEPLQPRSTLQRIKAVTNPSDVQRIVRFGLGLGGAGTKHGGGGGRGGGAVRDLLAGLRSRRLARLFALDEHRPLSVGGAHAVAEGALAAHLLASRVVWQRYRAGCVGVGGAESSSGIVDRSFTVLPASCRMAAQHATPASPSLHPACHPQVVVYPSIARSVPARLACGAATAAKQQRNMDPIAAWAVGASAAPLSSRGEWELSQHINAALFASYGGCGYAPKPPRLQSASRCPVVTREPSSPADHPPPRVVGTSTAATLAHGGDADSPATVDDENSTANGQQTEEKTNESAAEGPLRTLRIQLICGQNFPLPSRSLLERTAAGARQSTCACENAKKSASLLLGPLCPSKMRPAVRIALHDGTHPTVYSCDGLPSDTNSDSEGSHNPPHQGPSSHAGLVATSYDATALTPMQTVSEAAAREVSHEDGPRASKAATSSSEEEEESVENEENLLRRRITAHPQLFGFIPCDPSNVASRAEWPKLDADAAESVIRGLFRRLADGHSTLHLLCRLRRQREERRMEQLANGLCNGDDDESGADNESGDDSNYADGSSASAVPPKEYSLVNVQSGSAYMLVGGKEKKSGKKDDRKARAKKRESAVTAAAAHEVALRKDLWELAQTLADGGLVVRRSEAQNRVTLALDGFEYRPPPAINETHQTAPTPQPVAATAPMPTPQPAAAAAEAVDEQRPPEANADSTNADVIANGTSAGDTANEGGGGAEGAEASASPQQPPPQETSSEPPAISTDATTAPSTAAPQQPSVPRSGGTDSIVCRAPSPAAAEHTSGPKNGAVAAPLADGADGKKIDNNGNINGDGGNDEDILMEEEMVMREGEEGEGGKANSDKKAAAADTEQQQEADSSISSTSNNASQQPKPARQPPAAFKPKAILSPKAEAILAELVRRSREAAEKVCLDGLRAASLYSSAYSDYTAAADFSSGSGGGNNYFYQMFGLGGGSGGGGPSANQQSPSNFASPSFGGDNFCELHSTEQRIAERRAFVSIEIVAIPKDPFYGIKEASADIRSRQAFTRRERTKENKEGEGGEGSVSMSAAVFEAIRRARPIAVACAPLAALRGGYRSVPFRDARHGHPIPHTSLLCHFEEHCLVDAVGK